MANSYLAIAFQLVAVVIFHRVVSRRFLHPLRIYPGPFLASVTDIWYDLAPQFDTAIITLRSRFLTSTIGDFIII